MATHVALLRGINLGPHRRVAMGELREVLSALGYADVRTLLQSGNVVLTSRSSPRTLERELATAIAEHLGVETDVVVRTREDLAEAVDRNLLRDVADNPKRYQVSFCSAVPDAAVVREIEATDVAPEAVAFAGREIYTWHPNGIIRSPLLKLLDERRLGVTATARNWNTVTKLLALASE